MKTLRAFRTALLVIWVICSGVPLSYANERDANATSLESKVEQLTTTVYCYCGCTRETIQNCVCGAAEEVENEFLNRLTAGETVEQIRNDYLKTYGTQYSAVMAVEGFNIVAYVMPVIIIVLLGGVVFFVLKSKMGTPAKQPILTEENHTVSEERFKEIEAEVERYKQQR